MGLPFWLRGRDEVQHVESRPAMPGHSVDWPSWVSPRVQTSLADAGITRPWKHQVSAADYQACVDAGGCRALDRGVAPGGDIMIHGQPNQIPDGFKVKGDWTAGCIAVTNAEIEEIFAHAAIGTEVEIRP